MSHLQEHFGKVVQEIPAPDLPEDAFEVRILIYINASSIGILLNYGHHAMIVRVLPTENYNEMYISDTADSKL